MIGDARIAFIGGGNMASALIGGLHARGVPAGAISVVDPDPAARERLHFTYGVVVHTGVAEAIAGADVIVLAVKPQEMATVAVALAPVLAAAAPLVISVAAGVRIADLARRLGSHVPIVRTMPNRPALVGIGVTALHAGPGVDDRARDMADQILGACGATVWVDDESLMDAVTAVSGTGPAYFFLLIEALEAAAIEQGLEPATARRLAIETAHGAGRMAALSSDAPADLRAQVTSRGGTTAAAMEVLEAADVRAIFARAVAAATERSRQLANELGVDREQVQ
jgi:pyrroline-5-carboxylate reductase